MKIHVFLVLMIFVAFENFPQNYMISFSGIGASSNVDSVFVENLTTGNSLVLMGSDVLQLGINTSAQEINADNNKILLHPNPVQEQGELSFYAKAAGNVKISIIDISGKEVLNTSCNLLRGIQKFRISGIDQGVYFVVVKAASYNYNAKFISSGKAYRKTSIEYMTAEQLTDIKTEKSTKTIVSMAYTIGERLLFKGISGNYRTIVTDIPSGSKTISFSFEACSDYDNNNYTIVKIGAQTWMAENLKAVHYQNSDAVFNSVNSSQWSNISMGAYCSYNNIIINSAKYGHLFNYYAISDSRNLCPVGWHIPTNAEWEYLISNLGGEFNAGCKLKKTGTMYWQSPNISGNETGFSALPGGMRFNDSFYNIGILGLWWSYESRLIDMYNNNCETISSIGSNNFGASVRCIKN